MNNDEEAFAKMALELGGAQIKLTPSASNINLFDLDKPEITEKLLEQKECDLRALLDEANKCYMQGSLLAVDYLEKFDELPGLNDNSEWKERARKILQEFAEQISVKNLRLRIGMSQSRFANYMEIPVRTLQEWEQGKRTPPSYVAKMIYKIIQSENEKKINATGRILVEQYTEKDYTFDQLVQIYTQKMKNCRKDGIILEFIRQKPVFDENGQIIGVTTDFPAELNIYTYKVPAGINFNPNNLVKFDFFTSDIETALGCKKGKGESFIHPDLQGKEYEPYIKQEKKETSLDEIRQFINTLSKGNLVVVEITNGLKKSIYFQNELLEGIDQYTNSPVKVPFSLIKSINIC